MATSEVEKAACTAGNAGRYRSVVNGPSATSRPRITTTAVRARGRRASPGETGIGRATEAVFADKTIQGFAAGEEDHGRARTRTAPDPASMLVEAGQGS